MNSGLTKDHFVKTDNGDVQIDMLKIGMKILTHELEYKPILSIAVKNTDEIIRICTSEGQIECAPNQMVAVIRNDRRRYTKSEEVQRFDKLLVMDSVHKPIHLIESYGGNESVYFIDIGDSDFFVRYINTKDYILLGRGTHHDLC